MLQFRLHLLSVLLVIQTINSTYINESLIDSNDEKNATIPGDFDSPMTIDHADIADIHTNFTAPIPHSNRLNNQSTDSLRVTINQSNIAIVNQSDTNNSKLLLKLSKPNLPTKSSSLQSNSNAKLYNKADSRKRKIEKKSILIDRNQINDWKCPNISENSRYLECGCDMPHTLRCSGDIHGLEQIARGLRRSLYSVSLLDCTLKNVTFLSDARIFENVSLHGLVISSGEIKRVHRLAFLGMETPLQALGLPNNALTAVPWQSLAPLTSLDRLDLSNNRIKYLGASDFLMLQNLTYLELSDNHISEISMRTFLAQKKLQMLKLNGNRLEESSSSLQAIGQCINLKELDLASNSLRGPLTRKTLPALASLESLNLDKNLLTSIETGALQNFPFLTTLSLRHNQIDVLQDHAFSGLSSLQVLDLAYNGIVAISGASLQHLSRLLVLNLTHNFLRALTSDLTAPLPSLKELRLDGNDISIVAKNAFDLAQSIDVLSLKENPLSCDCSLKSFAEWLSTSLISSQDQLSAVCATPPHLEGAPLQQIPLESLNCDGNVNKNDNANVLRELEARSKKNNLTYIKDFSDEIILKKIHLSMDYGLILTWSVNLASNKIDCDAVFVYKENNFNETLMDNLPMHCESNKVDNENIVSVILRDTSRFSIGENYRFCLVLVQRKNVQRDLVVGCSNITKLKQIENIVAADSSNDRLKKQLIDTTTESSGKETSEATTERHQEDYISDILSFSKMSDMMENEISDEHIHDDQSDFQNEQQSMDNADENRKKSAADQFMVKDMPNTSATVSEPVVKPSEKLYLMDNFNDNLLPGIGIGILITTVFALIWAVTKLSNDRRSNPATVCYAAADQQTTEIENHNRYLKLQATTSL